MKTKASLLIVAAACSLFTSIHSAHAQGTAFTYQGRLNSGTNPANGNFDIQFVLYATSTGSSFVAGPVIYNVNVTNGLFTVPVDFGSGFASVFNGTTTWLEMQVRTNGGGFGPPLTPRQLLTPTPYAIYAEGANASNLVGKVPAANLSGAALLAGGNAFTGAQTVTSGSVGIGTISPAKQLDVTGAASGVAAGSSIESSVFMRVNNTATDGSGSVPDFAGIGFGHNSTRQAIVGGTFGNDVLDFYTGGLLTAPKMRIDFNGGLTLNDPRTGSIGSGPLITLNDYYSGTAEGSTIDSIGNGGGFTWRNGALELRPLSRLNVYKGFDVTSASQVAFTVVGSSGNVGVNTTSPGATLDVNGTANATTLTASQAIISGTIGIGTASPDRPLAITGTGVNGEWISFQNTNGATKWHVNNEAGGLDFVQSGVADARLFLSTNGSVGINTSAPIGHFSVQTAQGMASFLDGQFTPELVMTGGGAPGILRVRNGIEVWPNTNTTSAGKLDVRGTNGVADITLDGSTGEITCVAINMTSDRNAKEQFKPVNARAVLEKVASLPISEWQYKQQADTRHIGPMAQDFHNAFTLSHDEKHISVVDEGGVALAAIQGLNEKLEEQLRGKDTELMRLKADNQALAERLAAIEHALGLHSTSSTSSK